MNRKRILIGGAVAVLILGAIGAAAGKPTPTPEPVVQATPAVTSAPTLNVTPVPEPDITSAQRNAIDKAESYLAYTAFSRTGLIAQLAFEGFGEADAEYAVDSLDVDWDEQAYQKGLAYLDYTSFSLAGLIEQLEFEGFTASQAEYGATKAYGE